MKKLIIYFSLFLLLFSVLLSCSSENKKEHKEVVVEQTYTCSMHPQIIKNEMGTCPICGMDLVAFQKDNNDKTLKIEEQGQTLANIQTQVIGRNGTIQNETEFNGRLVLNPEKTNYLSAKYAGRIERLYFKEIGTYVNKGQAIYQIYSEELAVLQQEYLMTLEQKKQFADSEIELKMLDAAKQKLLRYGQNTKQIEQLTKLKQKNSLITVYAETNGVISALNVTEGQYVSEGTSLMKLDSYDDLWFEIAVYPAEAKNMKVGTPLKISVNGWENENQLSKVDFINPVVQAGTQMIQIRGRINNQNKRFQSGMQVKVQLAAQQQQSTEDMIIPVDAVIRDVNGEHVWLKTGKNEFEPRKVITSAANENWVRVDKGIKKGDQVVFTGAYMLYSEFQLRKGKHPLKD